MSEVEEVTEEPFLPPTPGATVMIPVAVRTVVALARIGGGAGLPAAASKVGGAVDDLVELATVKPDTSALGAVIDLDTLAVRHHQHAIGTGWTFHVCSFASMGFRLKNRYGAIR